MGKQSQAYEDDWDAEPYSPQPDCGPSSSEKETLGQPNAIVAIQSETIANVQDLERSIFRVGTNGVAVPHRGKPKNFPGFIARSALFRVSGSNEDVAHSTVVKAQGCSLSVTGPRLDMRDKHVWETAIQVAKERASSVSEAFEIELRDFARRMGSSNHGGRALAAIWDSLERLAQCRVQFELGHTCRGTGSLLATACRQDGKLYLRLNPDFTIPALTGDRQFLFDQARRKCLPTALSQWLHDFFTTHKQAREMDLLYLRCLCGYEGPPRNFHGKLEQAMKALKRAAPTLIASFEVDRTGRCSDSWKLRVVFGCEKPAFLPAEASVTEKQRSKHRSRVAL